MPSVISNWYGASPWPSANNGASVEHLQIPLSCLYFILLCFATSSTSSRALFLLETQVIRLPCNFSSRMDSKKEFCSLLGLSIFFSSATGKMGVSLVAQWQRIHLQMQEKQVQFLIQEDPTCHEATKLMHHNY